MYNSNCEDLRNESLREHYATTYGITGPSILNSRYFHVVNGVIPDIMHDILEGVIQLHTKCLLKYLILDEKMFTLSTLNDRILNFQYGPTDSSNKPSIISHDTLTSSGNTVRQSCK